MYSAHSTVINVVRSKYEVAYSAAGWWGGGWVMDSDKVMEMNREALYNTCKSALLCVVYTVQYSAVQYSTIKYSTVQYSTVQYSDPRQHLTQLLPAPNSHHSYALYSLERTTLVFSV